MAHAVETMAYAGERPWHGLGTEVPGDLTPAQMLKAAGLDWEVTKEPIYLSSGDNLGPVVPGQYALTRSKDRKVLSVVGENYKPTQNEEVLDFFQKFVEAGDMDLETAGSLHDGKYIWALARLKADFCLGKEDEVRSYLLFCNPHLYGFGRTIKFTSVRTVCWNTLCLGLGEAVHTDKKRKAMSFSIPHSIEFDEEARKTVEEAMGLATKQASDFEEAARFLAKQKAKKETIEKYFQKILDFDPSKKKPKSDGSVREPVMLGKFRDAYKKAPGQELRSAKGTMWGAFNAVTYVVDHEIGRTRDGALYNSWMSYTGDIKKKALDIALSETV